MTRVTAPCRHHARARRRRRMPFVRPPPNADRSVTVYVSTDRVFSEPILREYEKQSV